MLTTPPPVHQRAMSHSRHFLALGPRLGLPVRPAPYTAVQVLEKRSNRPTLSGAYGASQTAELGPHVISSQ